MRHAFLILAAVPLIYGCATAAAERPVAATGASCRVIETATRGNRHLEAIVYGPAGASGEYSLAIEKHSAGGVATTSQGGAFTIDPKGSALLAASDFDAGAIKVDLQVTLAGRDLPCSMQR